MFYDKILLTNLYLIPCLTCFVSFVLLLVHEKKNIVLVNAQKVSFLLVAHATEVLME